MLDDVSEIRPGSHSYGFVKTNSTDLDDEVGITIVNLLPTSGIVISLFCRPSLWLDQNVSLNYK